MSKDRFLLVCDVGNTAIKFGIARQGRIYKVFKTSSHEACANTGKLANWLLNAFEKCGISRKRIQACVVASVKPELNAVLFEACRDHMDVEFFDVPNDMEVPLQNAYSDPASLGSDRLASAWGAVCRYPRARGLIIADYGTAITFDCVLGRAFLGGLIFPGVNLAINSLANCTSRLPSVSLDDAHVPAGPAKDTVTCIQDGLLLGYSSITMSFCTTLERHMQVDAIKIATGGHAELFARATGVFDAVLPNLVLEGLANLYESSPSRLHYR